MEWIKLLQQAIDYMEEHLLEGINYEDVAEQVHMSCYNFHRTFSLMAGMTANEYLRNRRLSLAGEELQTSDHKVIDVAYRYGYETPESFSKAFTRFHGVSPKQAQKKGIQLASFNPLVIKLVLEGGRIMDYRVEEVGKQRFVVRVRAFAAENMNEEDNHEIPDFWAECHEKNLVEQIRNLRPEGKRDLYGLCSPNKANETTFDYGIGVLLDDKTDMEKAGTSEEKLIQEGFQIWETEPSTYVVFKCMGEDGDCISQMWSRFYQEFLPQSVYEQTEKTDYEIYFEKGESGLFCELWIPVKKHA